MYSRTSQCPEANESMKSDDAVDSDASEGCEDCGPSGTRCDWCFTVQCDDCWEGFQCSVSKKKLCGECDDRPEGFRCRRCGTDSVRLKYCDRCEICQKDYCTPCLIHRHINEKHPRCTGCRDRMVKAKELAECEVCGADFCMECLLTSDPVGLDQPATLHQKTPEEFPWVCSSCGTECRQCGVRHPAGDMIRCPTCRVPHLCPTCAPFTLKCFDC